MQETFVPSRAGRLGGDLIATCQRRLGRDGIATGWATDARLATKITSGAGRRVLGLDLITATRERSGRVEVATG